MLFPSIPYCEQPLAHETSGFYKGKTKMLKLTYPAKSKLITSTQPQFKYVDVDSVVCATAMDDGGITLQFYQGGSAYIEKEISAPVLGALDMISRQRARE